MNRRRAVALRRKTLWLQNAFRCISRTRNPIHLARYHSFAGLVLGLTALVTMALLLSAAPDVLASQKSQPQAAAPIFAPFGQGCRGTPSVEYAYANPAVISPGQVTTLYWGLVANASAAYLKYPNGHQVGIATPGSQQVNPTQTSTYTVIGACGSNQVQVPIVVTVQGGPTCQGAPVLQAFTANPSTINLGQSSVLSWGAVQNATYVQLSSQFDGGSGVPTPGRSPVKPNRTTTYYLTAWCQGNSAQAQVTININYPTPPTPTPPPQSPNQVRQVQVERLEAGKFKITVNYYWNGEDSPATISSRGFNDGGQVITNVPGTKIIAGFVKYVIQNLDVTPGLGKLASVTSCIVGRSGTELACLTVPAP